MAAAQWNGQEPNPYYQIYMPTVTFTDTPIAESVEDKPGVILDYDVSGNSVSL